MLAPNVIIPFLGTHAGIPAGFSRHTALDGKYPRAADAGNNPAGTGGNATHTHTSSSHTHTVSGHTHTHDTSTYNTPPHTETDSADHASAYYHDHAGSTTSTTSGSASGSLTYGSASNDPPSFTVIFIKPSGYAALPVNGMILSQATTRPVLTFHSASAGKYLKGATTGADAGGTLGSYDNAHSLSHTHTGSHSHTGVSAYNSSDTLGKNGGTTYARNTHTHNISMDSASDSLADPSTTATQYGASGVNIEPPYKTLNGYYNNTAVPVGIIPGDIAMWSGTLATIPVGWVLCDGSNSTPDMRSKFLKLNSSAGSSTTGGSSTHTHDSYSHSHSISGTHTHTGSVDSNSNQTANISVPGTGSWPTPSSHAHSLTNVQAQSVSYGSANTTADSSDNTPEYYTVAYIQYKFSPFAGILGLVM